MKKGLSLEISSDLDYEGMVVNIVYNYEKIDFNNIQYKQDIIAILNQDKGVENIEIKLYSFQSDFLEFSFKEFMNILEEAKKLLIQVNKEPK
jgi:hypothetical protein